jgi:hypothetical protein
MLILSYKLAINLDNFEMRVEPPCNLSTVTIPLYLVIILEIIYSLVANCKVYNHTKYIYIYIYHN